MRTSVGSNLTYIYKQYHEYNILHVIINIPKQMLGIWNDAILITIYTVHGSVKFEENQRGNQKP